MRPLSILFIVSSFVAAGACVESSDDSPGGLSGLDASIDASADTTRSDGAVVPDTSLPDAPAPDAAAPDTAVPDAPESDAGPDVTEPADGSDASPDAEDAALDAGFDAADAGPILVGSGFPEVLSLIADDTFVYFSTYGTKTAGNVYNQDGTVVRCPIAGGCAAETAVLATNLNNPKFIAIDSGRLIIGTQGAFGSGNFDGYVYSCPIAGCGTNAVDRVTLSPALQNLGGLTAKAGYAYWVQTALTNTCGRALVTGGGLQFLGNATGYSSVDVTVDDSNAYWTHTYYPPAMHVGPFTGDGGRVLVDIVAADAGLAPQALTHDNGYLYFVSVLANDVKRVRVDGGGLEMLAGGMHGPSWLALDDTHVYVADYYFPHPIRRLPKTGGGATLFVNSTAQITDLAVNAASVFWSTASGQVWRHFK